MQYAGATNSTLMGVYVCACVCVWVGEYVCVCVGCVLVHIWHHEIEWAAAVAARLDSLHLEEAIDLHRARASSSGLVTICVCAE